MNINNLRQFLFIAILAFAVINVVADVGYDSNTLSAVSECTRQFSTDFYKALATKQSGNFIFSPISLNFVLSMLLFGARGTAQEQLKSSLKSPDDENVTKKGYQILIDLLNNVTRAELRLANKLYTSAGYELRSEFTEITKTYFRSESENVDFRNRAKAAGTINNWCANQTNNRITEILKPDDLVDAVLVLVNAIYFKGTWKIKFNPENTENKTFHISAKKSLNVSMMHVRSRFYWKSMPKLSVSLIKLPYQSANSDEALSMYVIRPDKIDGLQNVKDKLKNINFGKLHGWPSDVILELPKFKIESTFDLIPTLKQMNITEIFNEKANFTGINAKQGVHVSKVVQKAFIEVNEEGSEAAAVTSVGITYLCSSCSPPEPKRFIVNRPFMYAIVHDNTNTVLFQGHVYNPNQN